MMKYYMSNPHRAHLKRAVVEHCAQRDRHVHIISSKPECELHRSLEVLEKMYQPQRMMGHRTILGHVVGTSKSSKKA